MSLWSSVFAFFATTLLVIVVASTGYLWLLALGSLRRVAPPPPAEQKVRFAVLIPAHNEAATIGRTLAQLMRQRYPRSHYRICVVADHCTDDTAERARQAGAEVFERQELPRGSKGAALAWLLEQLSPAEDIDAYIIFDADTYVDPDFMEAMNARLHAGERIIQGQHRIANGGDGPYPALAEAMMRIDNRFGNLGRSNLGLSAKHMGDSICFRAALLHQYRGQVGLTEDYALRLELLRDGMRIAYAPEAIGYGEAPTTWDAARNQRARWLSGTYRSSRRMWLQLAASFLRHPSRLALDGLLQASLPAFSTLTVLTCLGTALELALFRPPRTGYLLGWLAVLAALVLYPVIGLALDGAPRRLYGSLLLGPLFVVWRVTLALAVRVLRPPAMWIRTPRRWEPPSGRAQAVAKFSGNADLPGMRATSRDGR